MSSTCRHTNVAKMRRGSCLQPCRSHVSVDTTVHGVRPRHRWDQRSKDAVLKTIKVQSQHRPMLLPIAPGGYLSVLEEPENP